MGHKRLFLWIGILSALIFIILFYFLVLPAIFDPCKDKFEVSSYNGNHYANSTCYSELAMKTGNTNYCAKINTYSSLDCYIKVATQKKFVLYCTLLLDYSSREDCLIDFYTNLSLQNNNAAYCEKISLGKSLICSNGAVSCSTVEPHKTDCLSDYDDCIFVDTRGNRNDCYYELAQHTKNLQYCDGIKNWSYEDVSYEISRCYAEIQTANYIENNSLISTPSGKSENFTIFFNKTIECNSHFLFKNDSDNCFYYHADSILERFCNYESDFKSCFYWYDSDIRNINSNGLSSQEMQEICDTFVHPGLSANCRVIAEGKDSCLSYAQDNAYLKAICELEGKGRLNESLFPPTKLFVI